MRESRRQFSPEKDLFAPRFSKNFEATFNNLLTYCPPSDRVRTQCFIQVLCCVVFVYTLCADNVFFVSVSFGVAMKAEAGMTIYSQRRGIFGPMRNPVCARDGVFMYGWCAASVIPTMHV